jgi:hypothetical protein
MLSALRPGAPISKRKALAFLDAVSQQGGVSMSVDSVRQENYWDLNGNFRWKIEDWLEPLHLNSAWKQRALLKKYGLHQPLWKHPLLPAITVWMLFAALFSALLWSYNPERDKPADFATLLAGMLVLVFGYYQWRSSRYEKSMEDFYDRLNLANCKREGADLVSRILGHPWELTKTDEASPVLSGYEEHQWSMYVYSELDNLEYVVERYRLGYMQPRHALRGLRTFYQRCVRPPFRNCALKCARCMAYNESTIHVVKRVCADIEDRREMLQPRRSQTLSWKADDRRKARWPRRTQELPLILRWWRLLASFVRGMSGSPR